MVLSICAIAGGMMTGWCSPLEARELYRSPRFVITDSTVVQGEHRATAVSPRQVVSTYVSDVRVTTPRHVAFKFSLDGRDNERGFGRDHHLVLPVEGGSITTPVYRFGESHPADTLRPETEETLAADIMVTVRLDLSGMHRAFDRGKMFVTPTGDSIRADEFTHVGIAGSVSPLTWSFSSLPHRDDLTLTDPDGDGIYTVILRFPAVQQGDGEDGPNTWTPATDIDADPRYHSPVLLTEALYNMALDEMNLDVQADSTFMAGKEWPGVWTRDVSYSILLSLAFLRPGICKNSLLAKVDDGRIIQDTGTGGSWPVSTDRMTWALAAHELYLTTGDRDWLARAFRIIRPSLQADRHAAFNPETGLFYGESSFLDWREQTYPRWMEPKDIYASHALGTNVVFYQTLQILADMARELGEPHAIFDRQAEQLKRAINRHLWQPKHGYYGQFLYGRQHLSLSPRSETLGEALAVLFGVADAERAQTIIRSTPVLEFGPPCIYPQIPVIPPYHNNGIWPFVVAYWTWASALAENQAAVEHGLASLYRSAALFATWKENMVADTGDYRGTQVNSDRQLWSVAGGLASVYRVLFGMRLTPNGLELHPFIPQACRGTHRLAGFPYRNATLDLTVTGWGSGIKSVEMDGLQVRSAIISADLEGRHIMTIELDGQMVRPDSIRLVGNQFSLDTPNPTVDPRGNQLQWTGVQTAGHHVVLENGHDITEHPGTVFTLPEPGRFSEFQVQAVSDSLGASFLSDPVVWVDSSRILSLPARATGAVLETAGRGFRGEGYLHLTRQQNTCLTWTVEIPATGRYRLTARYANGSGPVNTDNKCALRTVRVDGHESGVLVFPQRGVDRWSDWGNSNGVTLTVSRGSHTLELVYTPLDRNTNGEVNEVLVDALELVRIE
jgi:hypothetical protein